jgi:putative hemolysin
MPIETPSSSRLALPLLSWAWDLAAYQRLLAEVQRAPGETFVERALHTLDIAADATGLERIPSQGATIVAANHPHGMVDGLALAGAVSRVRRDVRVLANRALTIVPELAEMCLFVDPSGHARASARSVGGMRGAVAWLREGRALIVFPAGEVAHTFTGDQLTPRDAQWHPVAGRLAALTGASVVPVFIEGRNREWFYRAGRLHPLLRTLLLPREFLRQRGARVTLHVGAPASAAEAADPIALRNRVEELRGTPDAAALDAEVRHLRAEHRVASAGPMTVYCTPAALIPRVLHEIGRLREITFRAAGEGTGQPIDLDRFDEHYLHLFVWHRDRREIVGAYRIAPTDRILKTQGVKGLYTSTLFHYDERLIASMGPAIELGRAFVRREYQRHSNALMLLWKGIAQVVARSGRYRVLFGAVSISNHYASASQLLMREFLTLHHTSALRPLVTGVCPPIDADQRVAGHGPVARDIAEVERMVTALEADGKGVPVLLRQYLRLNAKLLGFNVDAGFGGALDALMMVDLANVDRAILKRYFGGAQSDVSYASSDAA